MDEQEQTRTGRAKGTLLNSTAMHTLVWCLFSVVAVIVMGPTWDENYEFAQVWLGDIKYPEAHPLHLHAHNLFSIQVYLTALHVALGGDAAWVCSVRNVLYMLAKTLPFFLLGRWLSGRVAVGHVAAMTAFLAAGHGFTNVYPTLAWPIFSGNGVIGMGAAVLTVACLVAGRFGIGFGLAAAMPAIHAGHFPPVALLAGVMGLYLLLRGTPAERWSMFRGVGVGGLVTAVSFGIYLYSRVEYVPAAPYLADITGREVWERSTAAIGGHHGLQFGLDQLMMLWGLLLFSALAWITREEGRGEAEGQQQRRWNISLWLLIYVACISAIIWPLMALHAALHPHVSPFLVGWMPYRLANHLPPVIACALAAFLLWRVVAPGAKVGLAVVLLLPFVGYTAEETFTVLNALGLVALAAALRPRWLAIPWLLVGAGLWVWFLRYFEMDVELYVRAVLLSALLVLPDFLAIGRKLRAPALQALPVAVVPVVVVLAIALQPGRSYTSPVGESALDDAIRAMETTGELEPREMICVPYYQASFQGRLHHPVTADYAMSSWIPYHPETGPAIYALFRDLYKADLAPPFGVKYAYPPHDTWTKISLEEWQELGRKFGFRYVLMPSLHVLQLEEVLEEEGIRMYRIPGVERADVMAQL